MSSLLPEDYYNSILKEFPSMSIFDLRRCVDISIAHYYGAKRTVTIKDKIFVMRENTLQKIDRNRIRTKALKPIIKKNFHLMEKIKSMNISSGYIKNKKIVMYGIKDLENDSFVLYSIYFNRELFKEVKIIVYKDRNYNFTEGIFKKNKTALTADTNNIKIHEDICILQGDVISREIVIHELSLLFSKINKNLKQNISYKLTRINFEKATISLFIKRKINAQMLMFIKTEIKRKLNLELRI